MIAERDVRRVVDRIVALYDPDRIYVFGSYAKGELTENSDLDLLVVKPTTVRRDRRGRNVVAVMAEMPFDLDLLFVTPKELEMDLADPHTLLSTVMQTAITVYERGE